MQHRIRIPSADSQISEFGRMSSRVFNFEFPVWEDVVRRITKPNIRLIYGGDTMLGGLGFYLFDQWFGGNPISTTGIALVAISAENRGQGVGDHLLRHVLREQFECGTALATLFASTQVPYRKVGFEQAGFFCEHEMPTTLIGKTSSPLKFVPVESMSSDTLNRLLNERAHLTSGNISRTEGLWERIFDPRGDSLVHTCILVNESEPIGFVIYQQSGNASRKDNVLCLRDYYTPSMEAIQSLLHFVAGHRSIFRRFRWRGPVVDPLLQATMEAKATIASQEIWMIRIINAKTALTQRGYPSCLNGNIHFRIQDEFITENSEPFVLGVQNGEANIELGGRGDFELNIRDLSPLYSGLCSSSQLRQMGRLQTDDSQSKFADLLFSGQIPWMPDLF